jgi:hypothetical protein
MIASTSLVVSAPSIALPALARPVSRAERLHGRDRRLVLRVRVVDDADPLAVERVRLQAREVVRDGRGR